MGYNDWFASGETGLLTDLYEITMAACYFEHAMTAPATFSLFVRKMPERRSFLLAAGLDEALRYLEHFRFDDEAIGYLHELGMFQKEFLDWLGGLRFSGDVVAVPEGTAVFPGEPLLEVTAPVAEAQLVETFLLNALQLETLIATKAARVALAAKGRRLVDFASRRAHGKDASLKVARASYIAGFHATSNVLAGKLYGIPVSGTLAHSFVQAFEDEIEAFRTFARLFPESTVLLIDTYDTREGARRAAIVGQEMARAGKKLRGVRLDSGDVIALSFDVRRILDAAGLRDTQIIASGSLDEYAIEKVVAAGAPIDGFGIGTQLGVSYDAPALDIVYKMVQYDDRPVLKLSEGKQTIAGRKQVFRRTRDNGEPTEDVLALRDERVPDAAPLLIPVMKDGRRLAPTPGLDDVRAHALAELSRLPNSLTTLGGDASYPVKMSPALERLQQSVLEKTGRLARSTRA